MGKTSFQMPPSPPRPSSAANKGAVVYKQRVCRNAAAAPPPLTLFELARAPPPRPVVGEMFDCFRANEALLAGPKSLIGNTTSRGKLCEWLRKVCSNTSGREGGCKTPHLLFLVGPPGCGKSTTLAALLKDMRLTTVTIEGQSLVSESEIRCKIHPLINQNQSSVAKGAAAVSLFKDNLATQKVQKARAAVTNVVVVENACDEVMNKRCFSALVEPFRGTTTKSAGVGDDSSSSHKKKNNVVPMICVVNEASIRIRNLQKYGKCCDVIQMYSWSMRDMTNMLEALKARHPQSLRLLTSSVLDRFVPKCCGDPRWCLLQLELAAGRGSWLHGVPARIGQSSLWDAVSQILYPVVPAAQQRAYASRRSCGQNQSRSQSKSLTGGGVGALDNMRQKRLSSVLSLYFDNSDVLVEAVWRNRTQALRASIQADQRNRAREWDAILYSAELASDSDVLRAHDARSASFQLASYVGILGVFGVARATQTMRKDVWTDRPQSLQLSARTQPNGSMTEVQSFHDWHNLWCEQNAHMRCRCIGFSKQRADPAPPVAVARKRLRTTTTPAVDDTRQKTSPTLTPVPISASSASVVADFFTPRKKKKKKKTPAAAAPK